LAQPVLPVILIISTEKMARNKIIALKCIVLQT